MGLKEQRSLSEAVSIHTPPRPASAISSSRALIEVRLLGSFAVSLAGAPLDTLKGARLQALFAYLLLHRQFPQSRQHVAFLFWPDSSEAQAQSNLRNLLHSLRYALPDADARIDFGSRTVQWKPDSPAELDVAGFELAFAEAESQWQLDGGANAEHLAAMLRRAADLYLGDLLPSCYDEWMLAPRERLREKIQSTLERLVSMLEKRGDLNGAILYAQRLLRQDPLLEENYRRLMSLHLANGDRAGVLNVYKQCVHIFKRELGIEPGASTLAIMRQARDVTSVSSSSGSAPATASAASTPTSTARRQTPNNLPAQTTIFFGRGQELADLAALIQRSDVRLVTLTGTPGTGKTRLAISVAAGLLKSFPGGIYFVPLAAVDNPENVVPAIGATLGVSEPAMGSLLAGLQAHIAGEHMLLVLDNFEQVLAAASALAGLLAGCLHLKLLVTSREALNLRGEHEFSVQPLPAPPHDVSLRPEDLLNYESVALFLDRAREVSSQFALTTANARIIADICRRLEGLPLAIELAAARVKVLPPAAILSRLDRRLKLLTGGRLDLPPRQRALETAIGWSYNLLDETERGLFRALSVFSGGFTLEAVEATSGEDVLAVLSSLLGKSLLVRPEAAGDDQGEPRFYMLETLREYAWEKLVESAEDGAVCRQHALYFMQFAENARRESNGPQQQEWLSKTDREHDNLRAALRWAIEEGEAMIALRIAGALGIFWERRGYFTEGRRWLSQALDLDLHECAQYRAAALYSAGILALRQRAYEVAQPSLQQSRHLYKELGDKEGQSNALSGLAIMTLDRDYDLALHLHMESLALRRQIGDKVGIARTLQNIGMLEMSRGNWSEASTLTEEAHAIYDELGSPAVAYTLYVLAMVASGQGNYDLSRSRFEECLEIARRLQNDWLTAWALHGFGNLLYDAKEYEEANRALAEGIDLFVRLGDKLGEAQALISLGREAQRTNAYAEAISLYSRALALGRELDNEGILGSYLAGMAGLAAAAGQPSVAAMLFGHADKLLGNVSTGIQREHMTLGLDIARAALDPPEWEVAWEEGRTMPWQDAIALAQRVGGQLSLS
jgi:predicted ATPase/DNA-binding SARP family transcriptional activator